MKSSFLFFVFSILSVIIGSMIVGIIIYDNQQITNRDYLLSSPTVVVFEGIKYNLETYLWRDFMPSSPPDGKPLMVVIKVVSVENIKIPSSLGVDRLWIVNGYEIWGSTFSNDLEQMDENVYERVAGNGPKWDIGIGVEVIVRLTGLYQQSMLLRATNQIIERTD